MISYIAMFFCGFGCAFALMMLLWLFIYFDEDDDDLDLPDLDQMCLWYDENYKGDHEK